MIDDYGVRYRRRYTLFLTYRSGTPIFGVELEQFGWSATGEIVSPERR
jgi:hypothetical protein